MRKVIAFLMTVTVCLSLMIMPAMAAEDYPEVGFDFEAFEAQERIDGTPKVADGSIHLPHPRASVWRIKQLPLV